jgi:regulation of enolase protein 1 (concanavalin A-like superfamily)
MENDYILSYSIDGVNFVKFRSFYLKNFEDVKVGAYIANPNQDNFSATLAELDIE